LIYLIIIFFVLILAICFLLLLRNEDKIALIVFAGFTCILALVGELFFVKPKDNYFEQKGELGIFLFPILLLSAICYYLFYRIRIWKYSRNKLPKNSTIDTEKKDDENDVI
jgi:hypothetical protein